MWARDKQTMDELWRKRVKNDYLSLLLADKEKDDIRGCSLPIFMSVFDRK